MSNRLTLQTSFEKILGSPNVYYQPPSSVKMSYPAIVYSISNINNTKANNTIYRTMPAYEAILIDKNPDSEFVYEIMKLPYCRFVRSYKADNLNHFVFNLYNI